MSGPEVSLLPPHVRPTKYRITLAPDLSLFTFAGEEMIDLEVAQPTSEIVLNAAEISVQAASLTLPDGRVIPAARIAPDSAAETVAFQFGEKVPAGRAQLQLRFTGELNDRLHGFYRSHYGGPDGVQRALATTQFEATDARRAFPCWDEPAIKARFEVTLVVPSHLTAISNTTAVGETAAGPGAKRVRFAETPPMSTYLLAFLVGEFESVQARSSSGTTVRVWATPGKAAQGRFALETSVRLLDYYNEYFGIPYPLEKLDHIAVPDFAAGAMENWGAITYRETALLVDPQSSSVGTRQRVAEVVAHEMAHMWFGDLVTMAWWDDLWLNESFASWMATKAVDRLYPEWEMWTQFIVDDVNAGLSLDGLRNSHPIEVPVHNPSEIRELFDAISYSKGASVLRMLEEFLGEETFRKGLYQYLSQHQYGNARTRDLWQALGATSRQPVEAMMDSWVKQTGYPVLQASVHRSKGQIDIQLAQQRFLYRPAEAPGEEQALWHVPVGVVGRGSEGRDTFLMTAREQSFRLEKAAPFGDRPGWIKVNASRTGFYRVSYSPDESKRHLAAIRSLQLPPADRLGLASDTFALARAGLVPATAVLALAQAYHKERNYSVWSDLAGGLAEMELLLCRQPFLASLQAFVRDLLRPVVRSLGWDAAPGEGHLHALLRSLALGRLGASGDARVLAEARRRFRRFLDAPASLNPDLRATVYGLAAQGGDAATFDILRRLEKEATLHEERVRLLQALARFPQRPLLERTLELSLSDEVRSQDTVALVGAVAANPYVPGLELAWDFVKANWPEFNRRYGTGGFGIMRLVGITGYFTTSERRDEVQEFFRANPAPAAARTIQQSLERIDVNVRWLARNAAPLADWFAARARA